MSLDLEHVLVSRQLEIQRVDEAPGAFHFTVEATGGFVVLHPGRITRDIVASVRRVVPVLQGEPDLPQPSGGIDDPGGGGQGAGGQGTPDPGVTQPSKPTVEEQPLEVTLTILDPDGNPFTGDEITLRHLADFRTAFGVPRVWHYTLGGRSRTYQLDDSSVEKVDGRTGSLAVTVTEVVPSASAAPLIVDTPLDATAARFDFDLYREGDLVASITPIDPAGTAWQGTMRLLDPDGSEFSRASAPSLRCHIPLAALGRSRAADDTPRPWTLEVLPDAGILAGAHSITATVLGTGRINVEELRSRIGRILGPTGTALSFRGENTGGRARAILTITDQSAAETIDLHGVLEQPLKKNGQSVEVEPDIPLVIYDRDEVLDYGIHLDVSTLKTTAISVEIGAARHLAGAVSAHLTVGVEGKATFSWKDIDLGFAAATGDELEIEVGLSVDAGGVPRVVAWVPDEPLQLRLDGVKVVAMVSAFTAAGAALGGPAGVVEGFWGGVVTATEVEALLRDWATRKVHEGIAKMLDDPDLGARILMTVHGAHLTYLPVRTEGSDILFEHVAALEPEPRRPRADYAAAIGRTPLVIGPSDVRFQPPLGDTWAVDSLTSKIKHIVLVMMENRSYDHVLGHRSLASSPDGADGWTPDLVATVNLLAEQLRPAGSGSTGAGATAGTGLGGQPTTLDAGAHDEPVQPMRYAGFRLNEVGLRTRLPKGVGHSAADVAEQLAHQADGPGGTRINDPVGFVTNFKQHKLGGQPTQDLDEPPTGANVVSQFDVLRYYENAPGVIDTNTGKPVGDLPMFAFLADNYAYCDRYFCSHPGPTLPNRMYWLTGDLQHDRHGFPIVENNNGDNFLMSRATTLFDVLEKEGVSWRVYESTPSVAMLRMFARYLGDNTRIRPISDLATDFAADVPSEQIPSVVVIEPAMHHQPVNDDHPDADMYRGQAFIKDVYEALTANPDRWNETMLIITYDEHGGLYDHVIPPIAEVVGLATPERSDGWRPDAVTDGGGSTGEAPSGGGRVRAVGRNRVLIDTGSAGDSGAVSEAVSDGTPTPEPKPDMQQVPYGVRVPTFVVSPWVKPGVGPGVVLDHCSIVKTVLARFCPETKPFLSDRVHASNTFEAYLTEAAPRTVDAELPELADLPNIASALLPGASRIVTEPLFRRQMLEGEVDYHEISGRIGRSLLGR